MVLDRFRSRDVNIEYLIPIPTVDNTQHPDLYGAMVTWVYRNRLILVTE